MPVYILRSSRLRGRDAENNSRTERAKAGPGPWGGGTTERNNFDGGGRGMLSIRLRISDGFYRFQPTIQCLL